MNKLAVILSVAFVVLTDSFSSSFESFLDMLKTCSSNLSSLESMLNRIIKGGIVINSK